MYRQSVVVAPSREYIDVIADLSTRARRVREHRVDPDKDNLLRIFADQRAAALDLRLLGYTPSSPGKVDAAAKRITELHATNGGLQIVYADRGLPVREGDWSLYDELRDNLTVGGISARQIRYLHQTRSVAERDELLERCRGGLVGVLLTNSRQVPTDLPAAAQALHHLDCPASSNDLRRREGHADTASGVRVFRYITAGSYEAHFWSLIDRTAATRSATPTARAFRSVPGARADGLPPPLDHTNRSQKGRTR